MSMQEGRAAPFLHLNGWMSGSVDDSAPLQD